LPFPAAACSAFNKSNLFDISRIEEGGPVVGMTVGDLGVIVDGVTTGTTTGSLAEDLVTEDKDNGEGSLTEEFLDDNVGKRV
jgi:hypothetical protein